MRDQGRDIDQIGENGQQLIITNMSGRTVSYFPVLLDHPLDVWNLAASKEFQGKEITGFVLYLVDKDGVRHLRCGSKDGSPPGQFVILTLAPNESANIVHSPLEKFTNCKRKIEGPARWQVVSFRAIVGRKVNLAKPESFSILGESNTIDARREDHGIGTE